MNPAKIVGIQSTAGAIAVRNEKGEISMQKVKVQRYVSGKRPEYAPDYSSSESSDMEDFVNRNQVTIESKGYQKIEKHNDESYSSNQNVDDPRLKRLQARPSDQTSRDYERRERHLNIIEPEFVEENENETVGNIESKESMPIASNRITFGSDSDTDSDISESELEKKRMKLRQFMLHQQKEEILQKEDENLSAPSELESSGSDIETESEAENEPRLKPLFVRKRFRVTIDEKEREEQKQRQAEIEAKKAAKERRRATLKMVEESVKKDLEKIKVDIKPNINDVCTDDENDELEYEIWKLRELKRMKRDREERETTDREKLEIDRMHNLTEEERRQELRLNPKIITNKATKGKYKFLQKYYHRGAFYLDEENDVLKRDFAQATLEDHFDKTILPKVMQVKNFGRCGRTKYTHLVDQDTTKFDSPWYAETSNNIKFHNERAGGMKQVFARPTLSKRKKME